MPAKTKTICRRPGCPRLTREGYCDRHQDYPVERRQEVDKRRGTSTQRGYGARWRRFRNQILQGEPLCRICQSQGRLTEATDVDHIEPVSGPDDPTFFESAAVQPLCHACHSAKTAGRDGGHGNRRRR